MLLLFKPFASFEQLYNGISWNGTYSQFLEVTDKKQYIENIEELHKGIEAREQSDENDDEVIEEIEEDECEDDSDQLNNDDETGLDSETVEAIQVIESTPWLHESISNLQTYFCSNQTSRTNFALACGKYIKPHKYFCINQTSRTNFALICGKYIKPSNIFLD